MKQDIVCIAGAHRSGTSMLTRLLHRCGLYLGADDELMPAAADNPDGFWEHLRFVKLNDEILNALGAAWDLPPRSERDFDDASLISLRTKAHLLIESFAEQPIWGWKDPRTSLTLPFWKPLLPDLKTVIIVRNPLEVAYSMHKRNGTSYALGLRLWEIYNRRLLAHSTSGQSIFTNYASFFVDSERELRRIADFVGLGTDKALAEAIALIAVQRRHTAFTLEQVADAGVAQPVIDLYQTLVGAAKGREVRKAAKKPVAHTKHHELEGAESQLQTSVPDSEGVREELAARRGAAIQHQDELARHRKTIERLREELAGKSVTAAAEINRRDGRIEELQKAYSHLDRLLHEEQTQRTRLFAELETVRREWREKVEAAQQKLRAHCERERSNLDKLEKTQQQLECEKEELAQVRQRFAQTNDLAQKLGIRLADFEGRSISLTERLRKQLVEMKRLLRLFDQVDHAAALLRQSRRWKLANPFGAIVSQLTRRPLPGFGHLDKNVEKYRVWRANHPEMALLADEIDALRPREILPPSPEGTVTDIECASVPRTPSPPQKPVEFAQHVEIEISLVIPVYNQIDFTHACLAAIQEHSGDILYEVILVDDASTDRTQEIIGDIPGLVYLRAETNAGFIASCNRGAAAARGKYLVFLNNDTTVTAGWLSALRETFELEPEAGLVGSKLVYPDGRLQEAGGIIWRDGSGWNRGKFQDASKPEYNYLREVDYCSAASVMIPKALFDQLGGFDDEFAPAYYEDTDLAFKVAQAGRKVLYQPTSVVIHYEGITGGTDTSSGTKRYQEINRDTFVSKWASVLANKPENGDLITYGILPEGKRRILVIDHHVPMHDRDSGSLRMFNLLGALHSLGHEVTFIPDNLADISPYGDALRKRGIIFVHHPYIKSIREYLQSAGPMFDAVILSRCDFARKHLTDVREHAPQSRLIFDTVDLHFLRERRKGDVTGDPEARQTALEKQRLEFELIEQTDETWVVSPVERDLIRSSLPNHSIQVVSNIVELPGSASPFRERRDILFIGSFQHPPNTDGILFFCQEIFPLILDQLPGVQFYIIGNKPPPEIIALISERVVVTGYQPDVSVFFNTIKLSVAPLRYGAGVKGKINQSMGFGVPVVATPIATEGMSLVHGEEIMVAEKPREFAQAVVELYQNGELWERISSNALKKADQLFSPRAARRSLQRLFASEHFRNPASPSSSPTPSESVPVSLSK